MWAAAVKAAVTYALVGIPGVNIVGAGIATSLHFTVAAVLNLLAVRRYLGTVGEGGALIRVSAAGAGMAVVAGLSYRVLDPFLGLKMATVAAIGTGALAYFILAIVFRVFSPEDLASLPFVGRILGRFSRRKR
jgi:stage V sporulation protein B